MSTHKKYWDKEQLRRLQGTYTASQKRHETIVRHINKISKSSSGKPRILNVGIGNGYLEARLMSEGYEVFALDPSDEAVEILCQNLELAPSNCKEGSIASVPFESDTFDFVVMSEVIEHLEDEILHEGFNEVSRVLKKGGQFVGTVPCNEDLEKETFRCPSCMNSYHRVGHVKSYVPEELKRLLEEYFSVEYCFRFLGMHLNLKGLILHWWNDLPFKIVRLFRPNIRAPHQIEFNIFFSAKNQKKNHPPINAN